MLDCSLVAWIELMSLGDGFGDIYPVKKMPECPRRYFSFEKRRKRFVDAMKGGFALKSYFFLIADWMQAFLGHRCTMRGRKSLDDSFSKVLESR